MIRSGVQGSVIHANEIPVGKIIPRVGAISRLHRSLLVMPMLLLPFFLGGARPWTWAFVAASFFTGLSILVRIDPSVTSLRGISTLSRGILAALLLYPLLQVVPLPFSFLDLLSPERASWLVRMREATGMAPWWSALSHLPPDTLFRWMWTIFLAAFALVLRYTLSHERSHDWFFNLLFLVAALEALYGLLQALIPSLGVLWELPGSGDASGTFANRNHFAALLGMLWPLLLGRFSTFSVRSGQPTTVLQSERVQSEQVRYKKAFFAFVTGVVLLALFFSRSRGGILSALIAATLFVGLTRGERRKMVPFIAGCWLVMIGYGAMIGFEGIVDRFMMLEGDMNGRLQIWRDTWRMILDHPWTGTGLGTYGPMALLYQAKDTDLLQNGEAHNDYLQLAAELGLPMAAATVLLVWGFWWISAARLIKSGSGEPATKGGANEQRIIRAGALAGCAAFLFHSWMEFNWQIPAIQLYFVILLVLTQYRAPTLSSQGAARKATSTRAVI